MMADIVDVASEIAAEHVAIGVAYAARPIPTGTAGECEQCEWWMPRLVDGRCGFCRDGRQRPPDWEPPVPPSPMPVSPVLQPEDLRPMPAKTIMLPASCALAIAAVEALAKEGEKSLGFAAAELIEAGMRAPAAPEPGSAPTQDDRTPRQRMVALLDGVSELLVEQIEAASIPRPDPGLIEERDAWKARAETAEAKLDRAKALFV